MRTLKTPANQANSTDFSETHRMKQTQGKVSLRSSTHYTCEHDLHASVLPMAIHVLAVQSANTSKLPAVTCYQKLPEPEKKKSYANSKRITRDDQIRTVPEVLFNQISARHTLTITFFFLCTSRQLCYNQLRVTGSLWQDWPKLILKGQCLTWGEYAMSHKHKS